MIRLRGLKVYFDNKRVALGSQDVPKWLPDGSLNPDFHEGDYFASDTISLPVNLPIRGVPYGELNRIRMAILKSNIDENFLYSKLKDRGAIINDTLRPADIIPKALDLLAELNPDLSAQRRHEWKEILEDLEAPNPEIMDVWHQLDNDINDLLPEGLYYGGHYGDSASIGVWQLECHEPHPSLRIICDREGYHEKHGNGTVQWDFDS
jgi:hypothetical protein